MIRKVLNIGKKFQDKDNDDDDLEIVKVVEANETTGSGDDYGDERILKSWRK